VDGDPVDGGEPGSTALAVRVPLPGAARSLSNVRLHAECISAWVESSRCGCSRLFSGAPRIGRAAYIGISHEK